MKRYILLLAVFFITIPFFVDASPRAYLAEIDGEIKAGTVQYINRAIIEAEIGKADYLVIIIDTPGGLVDSTRRIINSMIETDVKTVVFVGRSGGWAYSAGTFILMAADYAFVHPEASIGAAEPRVMGESKGDTKMIEGMASWMENLAIRNERDADMARRFVTENLTMNGSEALSAGVINGTAVNLNELFSVMDIVDPEMIPVQQNFFEKVFDFLSHPYLVSLFLTLGTLGLIFAFRTGEFEIFGIIGLILLAIGLWGTGAINFSVLGIILLLLGVFLLAAEFFGNPGFGFLGVSGVISLLLGILNFGAEPLFAPSIFDFATLFTIGVLISLLIFIIITSRGVITTFRTKPTFGPESLLGEKGKVIETISPFGRVNVNKESWSARSEDDERIEKNSIVVVTKVVGNTLIVSKNKK